MSLFRRLALASLVLAPALTAQTRSAKPALTQADWDTWRSITGAALSNDGRWAVYTLVPQVGDGELVIRATAAATEYRVARGYLGRPNNTPGGLRPRGAGGPGGGGPGGGAPAAQITADSRFVLATVLPTRAETEAQEASARANRGAGRAGAANRNSLAIVRLSDGQVSTIPNVRSYRLPEAAGGWVAYVTSDSTAADSSARGGAGARPAAARDRRTYGSTVVLRNLDTGAEERLSDVLSHAFNDLGTVFVYTVASRDSTRDGAYARTLATGTVAALASGRGNYKSVVVDSLGTQALFLSDRAEFGRGEPRFDLFHARLRSGTAAEVIVTSAGLGSGRQVSDNATPAFTAGGTAVLFGIAPPVPDTIPADSLAGKAVLDLWHYLDPTLQPTQRLQATQDRNRSYRAIYYTATRKVVQLASDTIPTVTLSDDARAGLATSRERYQISSMWGDGGTDVYAVDPATGAVRLVQDKISGQAQLSPDGKFIAYYHDGRWFSYSIATGRSVDLTSSVRGVSFAQETWDTPSTPAPWGIAGWTRGDRSLLLYDRWDVWEFDPAGARPPAVVTDSLGRRQQRVLRVVRLDRRPGQGGGFGGFGGFGGGATTGVAIDPAEPLLLRAFDERTKASGFYRDRLGSRQAPEEITIADLEFGTPSKAADANVWMVTKETFTDFPDLWVGQSLTSLSRISDANPQQSRYNWGTVELVEWTSTDGVRLQGLLYKPEDFDPTRKYPMIAYFYEQLSQNRYSYIPPTGRNVINPTHYVSNGYLVFEPDIHYETGYPGPSAMKSIVPGVQKLLERGYVDPNRLGLQGQSWGGYQASYMITQTRMFAAAMAGAPVGNMTSAYGGIRWGSGVARAFQYETGQSRIGGSIWELPMRYIENSPLFWLDKVTTPLMMMHNDMDDAVPWYQGIELFVGLRRLGKEVYLLNYNNDVHNPASRANQKDVALRMQQFFDTKLKGAPPPDWMVRGIPYLEKGRDQLVAPDPTAGAQGGRAGPAGNR